MDENGTTSLTVIARNINISHTVITKLLKHNKYTYKSHLIQDLSEAQDRILCGNDEEKSEIWNPEAKGAEWPQAYNKTNTIEARSS